MKKGIAAFLVLIFCLGLTACGKKLDSKSIYFESVDGIISLWDSKESIEKVLGPPDKTTKRDNIVNARYVDSLVDVLYIDDTAYSIGIPAPKALKFEMLDISFPLDPSALDESFVKNWSDGATPGEARIPVYVKNYTKSGDAAAENAAYVLSVIGEHDSVVSIALRATEMGENAG